MIPFGEWLPDLPAFENPGLVTAENVFYDGKAYRPVGAPADQTGALAASCNGFYTARTLDGSLRVFAGTSTNIYELLSGVWASVYSAGASVARWQFVAFGATLLAFGAATDVVSLDLGTTGSTFSAVSGPLLSTTAAVVRDFVMHGNYTYSGASHTAGVIWSQINGPTAYAADTALQSGSQDLFGDWGDVTAVVGGEYGVVFQPRAIWRADYVGTPVVFDFTPVETGHGSSYAGSIVEAGNIPGGGRRIFYIGQDGFYAFDGNASTAIGVNRINDTFFADLNLAYADNMRSVAIPELDSVFWLYAGAGSNGSTPNRLLVYNYIQDRFTLWSVTGTELGRWLPLTVSMDAASVDMDTAHFQMDQTNPVGPRASLAIADTTIQTFNGDALAATIETGEFQLEAGRTKNYMRLVAGEAQLAPGDVALVRGLRVYTDGTPTVSVGARALPGDSVSYTQADAPNVYGQNRARVRARYARMKVEYAASASWTYLQGVRVEAVRLGRR